MEYDVDFSNVSSSRYLEPGTYRARLIDVEGREGRQAPLFAWTFADGTGSKSTITTSLSEAALWKLQEVLQGLGVKADGRLRISEAKLKKLLGRPAMISVIAEEGTDGRTYSKIDKVWPLQREDEPLPREEENDGVDVDFDEPPF